VNEPLARALVDVAMSRCLGRLESTGCHSEATRVPSDAFWKIAGHVLQAGSLQSHARAKPRGYAGDFELLSRICDNSCCDDPLGRLFDGYFLAQAAPQAVRSRFEQTANALAWHSLRRDDQAYNVLSVGAGPALDITGALSAIPAKQKVRTSITLVDIDPNALEFAAGKVSEFVLADQLRCFRANLFRFADDRELHSQLTKPDSLACAGLFDYLSDDVATKMLRRFWDLLAPGGLLLVGNFSPHNPTRAYMEWIGNWYLNYRNGEQLRRLANEAGIPDGRVTISADRMGVDLFIIAHKN
jgi:SAM-dependent methyltransferase